MITKTPNPITFIAIGDPIFRSKNVKGDRVSDLFLMDWIKQGLTSPPIQYRSSRRQF